MNWQKFQLGLIDVCWTLLAVVVIPSAIFWFIGQIWFIDRAIFNIDYMAACLVLIPFGMVPVVLGVALILILDLTFSVAPAYHFNLTSVMESFDDLWALEPGFLALNIGKIMSIILAGTWLVFLSLRRAQDKKIVAVTCLVSLVIISGLDIEFSANTSANRDMYELDENIASSSVNNLRVAITTTERGQQNQQPVPMDSASSLLREPTGIGINDFRTTILVVVESLGEFLDRNLNDYQLEPLLRLKDQVGVRVQTGAVGFEGSTVPGELRELCGIRLLTVNPSVSVLQTETCLPRTFHNLGYRTTAIHGFLGTLFSRNRWYPSLGFDDIWFAPELDRKIKNAKRCGIAFHGLCDTEIWNLIEKLVTRKPPTNQFIYWITLSAHLPIENLPTESQKHCNGFEVMARHPDLCSLVLKQRELFSRIAKSIGEKKINNTRILIVGDHAPPFLDARVRSFSDPANVPFIDIQS